MASELVTNQNDSLLTQNRSGILLLDNSIVILQNLGLMLEKFGFNVYLASSEFEGIELYKQKRSEIKLIVLDSLLSEITSLGMFSIFKTLDPNIKIIFIFRNNMDLTFWENLDIDFIIEPIQLNFLIDKIEPYLFLF